MKWDHFPSEDMHYFANLWMNFATFATDLPVPLPSAVTYVTGTVSASHFFPVLSHGAAAFPEVLRSSH